ncbi:hypothetical protein [Hydrogenophaga sp.]|uniref:hypothetical protein n=1 Tax=Hydrogenophaga sp. TaxID=1904254 RepID=UPI002FC7A706
MPAIDKVLHSERVLGNGLKANFQAHLSSLPLGTMFAADGDAYVVARQGQLKWSFDGYSPGASFDLNQPVEVLTPQSIVGAFEHGFEPALHSSAAFAL